MNFLYLYQLDSTKIDIPSALDELGHTVGSIDCNITDSFKNQIIEDKIAKELNSSNYDGVITFNFYPYISDICNKYNIPYLAWLFDSPVMYAYTKSILNKCNYIFCFDKLFCSELKELNVNNVYYMPLAANTSRLGAMTMTEAEYIRYNHDLTFVGRLFQDNNYNLLYNKLSPAYNEYFNKLFELQYAVQTKNVIYEALADKAIDYLRTIIPNDIETEYPLCNRKKCYCDIVLSRKYTELQRTNIFNLISRFFTLHIYTDSDTSMLNNVKNMGGIECTYEAPKLFYSSKVNLNITQITIQSGLPLRVFDIMGAGGFLISNAQPEFNELFKPGEEVILYNSLEELIDLINYYLNHDNERKEIAQNGLKRIEAEHTYVNRLEKMLKLVYNK